MRALVSHFIRLSIVALAVGVCSLATAAGTSGFGGDGSSAIGSGTHSYSIQSVSFAIGPARASDGAAAGRVMESAPMFLMPDARKLAHRLAQLEGEMAVLRRLSAQDADTVAALSRRITVDGEFRRQVEAWLLAATFLLIAAATRWSAALRRR